MAFSSGRAPLEHRIGDVRDSVFDGVVEALEFGLHFGRALAQFCNMRRYVPHAAISARRPFDI